MSDANKSSYKFLIARSNARRSKKSDFNQRFNSTLNALFPRTQPVQKEENKNYDKLVKDLENTYNNKLAAQNKSNQAKLDKSKSESDKAISNLTGQVQQSQKQFKGLSEGVQKALIKIQEKQAAETSKANDRPAPKASERPTTNVTQDPVNTIDTTFLEDLKKPAAELEKQIKAQKAAPVVAPVKKVQPVTKTSFNIGDIISLGNDGYSYRATNLYGPRSGANKVPGRKSGEHSRGVDLVSQDSSGNKVNIPIAIADGKITHIWKQGSGKAINTHQGKAAGYVMEVLSPNGKVITYAHLGPSIFEKKDELLGRNLKRGEVISNDTRWSGSGTGPHIKVFMSDSNKKGRSKRNYTDEGNDPTNLIFNGKYL